MSRVPCLLLAAVLATAAPWGAAAATITIDFESFPGPDGLLGTPDDVPAPACDLGICYELSDEYASAGVTFTSGTLFQGGFFPQSSPQNHFISSSPPDALLSRAVHEITIDSYSVWDAVLYGLDDLDQVIAADLLVNPDPGSFFFGRLRISSTEPIRRFTVLAAGCEIGGPCDQILNLDNLVLSDPGCLPGDTMMCLNDGRFRVEVRWRIFTGLTGSGQVVPGTSTDSGLFWFFHPDNWELLVKVLDGCGFNRHYWVFSAATTDVEYTLRVTDTVTGEMQEYFNPLGVAAPAITDTFAFSGC